MDASMNLRMAVYLKVWCFECKSEIDANYNSAVFPNGICEFRKLNKFCEFIDLPGLNSKTFIDHAKVL